MSNLIPELEEEGGGGNTETKALEFTRNQWEVLEVDLGRTRVTGRKGKCILLLVSMLYVKMVVPAHGRRSGSVCGSGILLGMAVGGSRSRGSGILRTRSSRGTDNMNRKLFTKDRGGEGGVNSALEYLVGLEG